MIDTVGNPVLPDECRNLCISQKYKITGFQEIGILCNVQPYVVNMVNQWCLIYVKKCLKYVQPLIDQAIFF